MEKIRNGERREKGERSERVEEKRERRAVSGEMKVKTSQLLN